MGPWDIVGIVIGVIVCLVACVVVALVIIGVVTVCRALSIPGTLAPLSLEHMPGVRVPLQRSEAHRTICPSYKLQTQTGEPSGQLPAQTHYAIFSGLGPWGKGQLDCESLVVFVHGFADNVESLTSGTEGGMARHLVARGFCLLAFDWAGHGFSDAPEGPIRAEDVVEQLEELLEHLEVRAQFHLFGFSFGALCASLFAAKHPQKLKSLVFLAPFRGNLPFSRSPLWPVWVAGMGLLSLRYPEYQSWGVPELRTLCQVMLHFDSRCWASALSRLRETHFPVLVSHGSEDDHWIMGIKKHARSVHAALPQSRLCVLEGSAHMSWYMGSKDQQEHARQIIADFLLGKLGT